MSAWVVELRVGEWGWMEVEQLRDRRELAEYVDELRGGRCEEWEWPLRVCYAGQVVGWIDGSGYREVQPELPLDGEGNDGSVGE